MIAECIFEVYNRDSKVFIPDFGALIYSEFNNDIDFNSHLTFDDGKIVAEIAKRRGTSDEEARIELYAYIQEIKDAIGKGKLHFIKGIGQFSMDQAGNYVFKKSNPSDDDHESSNSDDKSLSEPFDPFDKPIDPEDEQKEKLDTHSEPTEIKKSEIWDTYREDPVFSIDQEPAGSEALNPEMEFKAENYHEEEEVIFSDGKQRYPSQSRETGSNKILLWILAVAGLILIGSSVYYFGFRGASEQIVAKPLPKSISEALSVNNQNADEEITEETETSFDQEEVISSTDGKAEEVRVSTKPSGNQKNAVTPEDEAKTFCLILGSFKEEKNADRYLNRIRNKVPEATKIAGKKGFYFVAVANLKGKTKATRILDQMQKDYPKAWIYNQALL